MVTHAKVISTRCPPVSAEAHDGGRAPGVLHPIMIRGTERRKIFRDDKDRENFLERPAKLLPETQTAYYACPVEL